MYHFIRPIIEVLVVHTPNFIEMLVGGGEGELERHDQAVRKSGCESGRGEEK